MKGAIQKSVIIISSSSGSSSNVIIIIIVVINIIIIIIIIIINNMIIYRLCRCTEITVRSLNQLVICESCEREREHTPVA